MNGAKRSRQILVRRNDTSDQMGRWASRHGQASYVAHCAWVQLQPDKDE